MDEPIKNKNSFIDRLRSLVKKEEKQNLTKNMSRKQYIDLEVEKAVEERRKLSPIVDLEEEKKFRAEMRKSFEAAYDEKEISDTDEDIENKEKESKDKEKSNSLRNIDDKSMGYLDRLELLHQIKMKMLKEQRDNGNWYPDTKEAYKVMIIEASVEKDREAYINSLDENERKRVLGIEENYKNKELDIVRKQNKEYRENLDEFGELNKKLRDINDWFEEFQKQMREGKVNEEDYRKQVKEKQVELDDVLADINRLNPQKLQEVIDERNKQQRLSRTILGSDYAEKVYVRSSDEMKQRLDYLYGKNKYQEATIISENRFLQKEGIERTIDEYENHRKHLEKELESLKEEPENIDRRAEIIKELRITDAKIDGYENTKEALEKGMAKDVDVEGKIQEESRKVEEDIKEVENDFEDIDKITEKSKEDDFDMNSARAATEKEIRDKALKTGVTVGVATKIIDDCPHDTEHAVIAGAVAGKIKENSLRQEWENAVSDQYNAKDVKTKQERDKALQKELDEQEQVYERERIRKD